MNMLSICVLTFVFLLSILSLTIVPVIYIYSYNLKMSILYYYCASIGIIILASIIFSGAYMYKQKSNTQPILIA